MTRLKPVVRYSVPSTTIGRGLEAAAAPIAPAIGDVAGVKVHATVSFDTLSRVILRERREARAAGSWP